MRNPADEAWLVAPLLVLLCGGILTLWIAPAYDIFQAGAFALAIAWVVWLLARNRTPRLHPALAALFGAAIWPLVQLAANRSVYRWETWNALWVWVANAALCVLALEAAAEPKRRRVLLNGLLYFGVALAAVATLQMFTSHGKIFWLFPSGYPDYVLGPFVNRDQYAAWIELLLPLALYRAVVDDRKALAGAAMAAVMLASVVAGASRAGTVLVLAELVAVPLLASRARLGSRRAALMTVGRVAAMGLVFCVVVGGGVVWNRLFHTRPESFRRDILIATLRMAGDRPGMGFGLGTWAIAYPGYALFDAGATVNQAHNDWAQWAAEGGLPFLALMLAFAAMLARPAARSIWGIGALAFLLHCLVDFPLQQRPAVAAFLFAFAGMILSATANRR